MGKRFLICLCLGIMILPGIAGAGEWGDFEIADRLMAAGKIKEAVNVYQMISKYYTNQEDRARALLLEGTAQGFILGCPYKALACFDKILFLYPTSPSVPDALFQSGIIYYGQQRFKRASDAFSTYMEDYPLGIRCVSAAAWQKDLRTKADDFPIRVLVTEKADRLTVQSDGTIVARDVATGRRVCPVDSVLSVTTGKDGLMINGRIAACRQVRITSTAGFLNLNNYRSRGEYFITDTDNGLQAVNQVPLEQYLYGIVPQEMPYTWSREALMAQAVASRTYVLYNRTRNKHKSYDVTASAASQVYGGIDAERTVTTSAVDATRGQVMAFDGRLVAAYFHADSGGHTEDARFVWDVDIPYLKGAPDKFSENSSESAWQCRLSFDQISKKLKQAGVAVGAVRRVRVLEKSPTGRVLKIQVVSDTGDVILSGNHFRVNLGPTCIRSTCFQVTSHPKGIFMSGKGYGHGVGMSQLGAARMAEKGFTYRQILGYYYPGVAVIQANLDNHEL